MGRIANVRRVTKQVGGEVYNFRSMLEYRWAVYCQLRKEQGIILDWWFEDSPLELEQRYFGNKKIYLPDFTVQVLDKSYEFEETKGYFPPKDYTKIKLAAEQYENPITLIFANLVANSKNAKTRAQRRRAERLEPYLKRIIYFANRDIFRKISGLFER